MSRLDNLGGYGQVTMELQKYGGDIAKYHKAMGNNAVAKSAPALMTIGGVIVLVTDRVIPILVKNVRIQKKQKKLPAAKASVEQQSADKIVKELEEPEGSSGESEIVEYESNMDN